MRDGDRPAGSPPDPRQRGRRIALGVLVALVIVLNLVPGIRRGVTSFSSSVVSSGLGWFHPHDAELDTATKGRLAAEDRADRVTDSATVVSQARALLASFGATRGHRIVLGRALAMTPVLSAGDARQVQLDVGSAEGVARDEAVVSGGGLVGRTTAVEKHTSTLTLITDPQAVVGARVERSHALARVVGKPPAGVPLRAPGRASLVVAEGGSMRRGDRIVTAGSPGGTPYPAGLPVGTLTSVDPDRGQLERAATLQPVQPLASLDVVGVLVPTGTS